MQNRYAVEQSTEAKSSIKADADQYKIEAEASSCGRSTCGRFSEGGNRKAQGQSESGSTKAR